MFSKEGPYLSNPDVTSNLRLFQTSIKKLIKKLKVNQDLEQKHRIMELQLKQQALNRLKF